MGKGLQMDGTGVDSFFLFQGKGTGGGGVGGWKGKQNLLLVVWLLW